MLIVDDAYVRHLKKLKDKKPRLSTLYGMDRIFREVYEIPSYIPVPLVCLLEHGVNFQFKYFFDRLKLSENELIFLDNAHRVKEYAFQTGKVAYPIGPLYPKYRKLKNIQPKEDRAGTLVFPSHSNSQFDFSQGYKKYAEDLKALPQKYHPVTICMYYYDILNDRHKIFEEAGYRVITNGHIGDSGFVDLLYNQMSEFQYVTSNHEGSYSFYALEMGIPFFLYGDDISGEFLKIETLNGINMKALFEEDFLKKFTSLMRFDVNSEIKVTPELRACVDYIIDEQHQMEAASVRKIVLNNWIELLLLKFLYPIKKLFN